FLLMVGFFLALCTLGCRGAPSKEETAPPAPVKVEPAKETDVTETVEILGQTVPLPNHGARITANVSAPVLFILQHANGQSIVEGQRVSKGQVIDKLDDMPVQQQKIQAETARDHARNNLDRLKDLKENKSSTVRISASPFELKGAELTVKDA